MSTKRKSDADRMKAQDYGPMKALSLLFLTLLTLGMGLGLMLFLIAPPRLVVRSESPDRAMRLELWKTGFMGPTWADLIWQNQWKKENVYREGGDEVIWSKDTEVVWSKDSQRFFVASAHMVTYVRPALRDNPYLYLTHEKLYGKNWQGKYPAVVLTYNIPAKALRHNLYTGLQPFDRRDLQGVDWTQKLPE
jgi:hypothetical protein